MVSWDVLDSMSHLMLKPEMIKKALDCLEDPRKVSSIAQLVIM